MSAARDALDRLVRDNPEASKEEIKALFIASLKDDPELMRAIAIEVRQEMFIFDPNRAANVVALTLEQLNHVRAHRTSILTPGPVR